MGVKHLVSLAVLSLSLSAGRLSTPLTVEQTRSEQTTPAPPAAQTTPSQAKPSQAAPSNQMAKEMAAFVARVEHYTRLRDQLTAGRPRLTDTATPEELDTHQRALAALIVAARSGAKAGDIFVPEMQTVVRGLMAGVFKNAAQRAELKATIAEEYPTGVTVAVNTRYPEGVPLATMPPEVLKNLPHLPKECEYRFVGESLILLDTRAYLIVDVMSFSLPKN